MQLHCLYSVSCDVSSWTFCVLVNVFLLFILFFWFFTIFLHSFFFPSLVFHLTSHGILELFFVWTHSKPKITFKVSQFVWIFYLRYMNSMNLVENIRMILALNPCTWINRFHQSRFFDWNFSYTEQAIVRSDFLFAHIHVIYRSYPIDESAGIFQHILSGVSISDHFADLNFEKSYKIIEDLLLLAKEKSNGIFISTKNLHSQIESYISSEWAIRERKHIFPSRKCFVHWPKQTTLFSLFLCFSFSVPPPSPPLYLIALIPSLIFSFFAAIFLSYSISHTLFLSFSVPFSLIC